MATFITLVNFTRQGIEGFRDTPERAAKFESTAKKAGVTVRDIYWTMGSCDAVLVLEAADDETVTAAMLSLASGGNVRTQTLRAFDSSEMKKIISKVSG